MPLPAISPGLVHMFGARSGWSYAMPSSTTATSVLPPVKTSQASGASMSASGSPPIESTVWPVLSRPQSWPKRASLGTVADAVRQRLGSA